MIREIILAACILAMNNSDFRRADKLWNVMPPGLSKELQPQYDYLGMCLGIYRNDKDSAKKYAFRLKDSFQDLPRRYYALADMVIMDTDHWKPDNMEDVSRNMANVKTDLRSGYVDKTVQLREKKIIDQLDKMIEEKENPPGNGIAKKDADGNIIPMPGTADGIKSPSPATESAIATTTGNGIVDDKKLRALAEAWGTMPAKDRAKAIMDITRDYPARYRVIIEDYFKALAGSR